jgi:DNA-binding MarR family transcriptional regulator
MSFYKPSDYTPDRSIGYLMRVINQATLARLEPAVAGDGMTNTQWQVLASLYFDRGATCASLARDLAYDKGAMTRLVDGLAERGLVARERDTGDRRVVNLTLTEAGREAAERGRGHYVSCWNGWLDGWERGEVETLIAMLQRLHADVDAAPETCA